VFFGLGAAVNVVGAAETEFDARILLGVAKLDNVLLAPPGEEVDDLAYIVSPELNYSRESPNWDANLDYVYAWFRYSDLETDSSYHSYTGSITGKALREALQVEVGAERSQTLADPNGVIPTNQLPLSDNLIDEDIYFINPRFSQTYGEARTLSLGYRHAEIRYDDPSIQDSTSRDAYLSLDNLVVGQGLTWALEYQQQKVDFEVSPLPWEFRRARAELGFWANSRLRLFGSGGRETPWDDPIETELTDSFWEAGFAYSLRDRLRAEFAGGERSFGNSWRGEVEYLFKRNRGRTAFSYSETPTTIGFDQQRQNPLGDDPDVIGDFLNQPGSAERYISEYLQWSLSYELRRTDLQLYVFDENRINRFRPNGDPLEDERQRGASISVNLRPTDNMEIALIGRFVNREREISGGEDFLNAAVQLGYAISRRMKITAAYNYSEQRPMAGFGDIEGDEVTEYEANVVSLILTLSL